MEHLRKRGYQFVDAEVWVVIDQRTSLVRLGGGDFYGTKEQAFDSIPPGYEDRRIVVPLRCIRGFKLESC